MGVELHGVTHDVGHLVVAAVVHAFHRMENTSLYGFQAILDVGNGTFQDDIRGIVEKPVLIHAAEVVDHRGIKAVYRLVVGMGLGRGVVDGSWLGQFFLQIVYCFVAHGADLVISSRLIHLQR